MRADEVHPSQGEQGTPPPMDESWWAAVLRDEPRQAAPDRKRETRQLANSYPREGSMEDWAWARGLYEADDTVELPVVGYNRGGLLVEARTLRGFVPLSHVVEIDQGSGAAPAMEELGHFIGRRLRLKVIEYDPERGRLVFSERAALAGPGRRLELMESLKPGACVRGRVTNVTRFGVFVDLGGVEGLVHVSELSWGRVGHPSEVAACGQELQVQVLSVDPEQGRIALSVKELLPDPWQTVDERYELNQLVEGVVTNVVKFGAFVCLTEGLEGLIHVSEFGDGNFLHPRSVIREGETVTVRIIHIDANSRRLGLSLRQVPNDPEDSPPPDRSEREALSSI